MGNDLCTCARKEPPEKKAKIDSNTQIEVISKPQSPTPYENNPFRNRFESDSKIVEETEVPVKEYPITPEYKSEYQSEPDSYNIIKNKRPSFNYSTSLKELDSVFSPESDILTPTSDVSSHIYELILKDFFKDNYPMNNEIICEMTKMNLLSSTDSSLFLEIESERSKLELFFDRFVFSETNICKLATFLFVLISEKNTICYSLNQKDEELRSIVDHIYYVVNFINLIQNYVDDFSKLKSLISQSYLISIYYISEDSSPIPKNKTKSHRKFYIKAHFDNLTFPPLFWSIFSKINEDFLCCREIIVSSCGLTPEDTYNLIQGLKSLSVLKVLDVSANPLTDAGLKHIQSLFQMKNHIETLNLACCSLTHISVEEFLEILSHNTFKCNLKSLNLSHNDLDNLSQNDVLVLTKLPLANLELQSTNMKYQKALFESLKLNYSLKHLDISKNRLLNRDLTFLASGLAYNNNLKSISLAMIGLNRNDCETLNNTFLMNKSLVSIDLSDNAIGDEGIEILKDIIIMKKTLREVILKRCNISLHGILLLLRQAAESDCRLRSLDLCYNRCPRMSVAFDSKDMIRKIKDILHHIGLVKQIRILLWGTLDLSAPNIDYIK